MYIISRVLKELEKVSPFNIITKRKNLALKLHNLQSLVRDFSRSDHSTK